MSLPANLTARWATFDELSLNDLYEVLKLRQDIFILEQASFMPTSTARTRRRCITSSETRRQERFWAQSACSQNRSMAVPALAGWLLPRQAGGAGSGVS